MQIWQLLAESHWEMTELKDKPGNNTTVKDKAKDKKTDKEKTLERKNNNATCFNQKYLQLCAWSLLTIGLCIVVTTFYLALQKNSNNNDPIEVSAPFSNSVSKDSLVVSSAMSILDDGNSQEKTGRRFTLSGLMEVIERNRNGCETKFCHVACSNADNVYESVYEAIESTACPSMDVLLIERQDFPLGVLKNNWLPSNISFYEIVIRYCNITKIKNSAFNTPQFKDAYILSLSNMNIGKVDGGALLGLFRLKYLTIKCRISKFEAAIFQPVQTTLVNLKLNAELKIHGNRNFFGVSYLHNLVYLDLSNNMFVSGLSKNLFKSTPNLKYLVIMESQIRYIEPDTFENLKDKLIFVNLSKNFLTNLAAVAVEHILVQQNVFMLNLANNDWNCNCDLKGLAKLYRDQRLKFMDVLYCKAPHKFYGMSLDEVDFEEQQCFASSTRAPSTGEEVEIVTEPEIYSTKSTTSRSYGSGSSEHGSVPSNEMSSVENSNTLKMRCFDNGLHNRNYGDIEPQDPVKFNYELLNEEVDYLQFPAPTYDFELQLIPENNSAKVSIRNPSDVLVIWFSEQLESSIISYGELSMDYECVQYATPELIVGPLHENTTYTFCLLPTLKNDISPFNCLPLHVPSKRHENIWISEDNKNFTIGMLCLIFLLSTIAGALIAYFGIKNYPDLLEGSKNVLVVKKPDKSCYVATVSEMEYHKQTSFKKSQKTEPLKKQSSIKLPLPETPSSEASPYRMSVKDLERLSSLKSSSTCFEDTFPSYNFTADDEYETPKLCSDEYSIEHRSIPNMYGMSPKSPPPLPKRNSSVSNSSTLVINRFSNSFE